MSSPTSEKSQIMRVQSIYDKRARTLEMYEKILIGDMEGIVTLEDVKKAVSGNQEIVSAVSSVFQKYGKLKDAPLQDQMASQVKRYKKGTEEAKETAAEFEAAGRKSDKILAKYKGIPKVSVQSLENTLKPTIHDLFVLAKGSRRLFRQLLDFKSSGLSQLRRSKKAFVLAVGSIEDCHVEKLRQTKRKLRNLKHGKKTSPEEGKILMKEKASPFNNALRKAKKEIDEKLSSMESEIEQMGKKIKKLKLSVPTTPPFQIHRKQQKQLIAQFKEAKEEAYLKAKAEKEEAIAKIKLEMENAPVEEELSIDDEETKKRYLLALKHLEKHMKEYPGEKKLPQYPGQVL